MQSVLEAIRDKVFGGSRGAYECAHCRHRSVGFESDCDFEDFGLDGTGIVKFMKCYHCGADIEYWIPFESEDEDEESVSDSTP